MKANIIGRKFDVSERFKGVIERKLKKFDKFFTADTEAAVTLSRNRGFDKVEITIFYKSMVYRAEVEESDMLSALDRAVGIIERQIRKNKTKLEKRLKTGAFEVLPEEGTPSDFEYDENVYKISKVKRFNVKPMSAEEAILQMELSGHTFFLFRNDVTGEINVVYKKLNNEYGLIEPEDE